MKKTTFSLLLVLFSIFTVCSQTTIQQIFPQGINYQAVARDTNGEILAGQDVVLKINLGESNVGDYAFSETHTITTNDFGLFSLFIGKGTLSGGNFYDVPWSSGNVWIDIEIQNEQGAFETISSSKLWAVPYALHALSASEISTIPGEVAANWSTTGNADTNPVDNFIGTKDDQALILSTNNEERLRINSEGKSKFSSQVTINADISGDQESYNAYPLKVEGGNQGVAIKINQNTPTTLNNFITFFGVDENGDPLAVGRIEGNSNVFDNRRLILTKVIELMKCNNAGGAECTDCFMFDGQSRCFYNLEDRQYMRTYFQNGQAEFVTELIDVFAAGIHVVAKWVIILSTTGIGALVSDPDDAIMDAIGFAIQLKQFQFSRLESGFLQSGVSFESGGADYAEWLMKANPNEQMAIGDVVGVKGGKISKTFTDANQFMAITSNPIIVGAMPNKGEENHYEKVGMMGQVQILVGGRVNQGDYILPSGRGDGTAIAVNPNNMRASEYSKIIGVAWSNSSANKTFNYINTAIGFSTNQMGMMLNTMQNVMNHMQSEMVKLNPDYKPVYFDTDESTIRNPYLAFGINSDNFFGYVKDFINQNPTPGPNGNIISINGIATGNIINKIIKRYVNEDMVIDDVEAGNIINKIIKQYLNEWGTPDAILDDNLIRQIVERTKEIDGEEMNLVVELMKKYLDDKVTPLIPELVTDTFDTENGGILNISDFDDFPVMKDILIAIRDNQIFDSGIDPELLKQQLKQLKEGIAFLQFLISE